MTEDNTRAGINAVDTLVKDAYYDGQLDFETVAAVVGTEEATRMRLLQESLDHEPPLPAGGNVSILADEMFYESEVPTWTPEHNTETDAHGDGNQ